MLQMIIFLSIMATFSSAESAEMDEERYKRSWQAQRSDQRLISTPALIAKDYLMLRPVFPMDSRYLTYIYGCEISIRESGHTFPALSSEQTLSQTALFSMEWRYNYPETPWAMWSVFAKVYSPHTGAYNVYCGIIGINNFTWHQEEDTRAFPCEGCVQKLFHWSWGRSVIPTLAHQAVYEYCEKIGTEKAADTFAENQVQLAMPLFRGVLHPRYLTKRPNILQAFLLRSLLRSSSH